ncbi:MAG: energy transducer TonB [Candidatus Binataceae bacterium]
MKDESNLNKVANRSADDRAADDRRADARGYSPPPRHLAAIGGSIAAHALILGAIIFLASRAQPRGDHWVLAYVIDLGAAHGTAAEGGGALRARLDLGPAAPPEAAISRKAHRRSRRALASIPSPPIEERSTDRIDQKSARGESTAAPASRSAGANRPELSNPASNHAGSGGSGGQGAGGGAGGTSIAGADYGSDPAPAYPAHSRRRGEQGTVTLHVLIAASGAVERVELLASSGFRGLDDAAIEVVRERWRFVPARRDGLAIESWAIVPIRFTLTEASN